MTIGHTLAAFEKCGYREQLQPHLKNAAIALLFCFVFFFFEFDTKFQLVICCKLEFQHLKEKEFEGKKKTSIT